SVACRQPGIELLVQSQDLSTGAIELTFQAPRPARLIREPFQEPAILGGVLMPPPPTLPTNNIDSMRLAGQLRERLGGRSAKIVVRHGKLGKQGWHSRFLAASAQSTQGRLASEGLGSRIADNRLEALDNGCFRQFAECLRRRLTNHRLA